MNCKECGQKIPSQASDDVASPLSGVVKPTGPIIYPSKS